MTPNLFERIKEIAERGRTGPRLPPDELNQRIKEIVERGRTGPRLSHDELWRRIREIANGQPPADVERPKE
jgi:uncharacterized coiled-coil DUF342 family protein